MKTDPWSVLGIERGASEADIKRAYKAAARKYHPDLNPGNLEAEAKFKEVAAAYEAIQSGEANQPEVPPTGRGGFWDFTTTYERHERGPYVDIPTVRMTFEEYCIGATKQCQFVVHEPCVTCDGKGAAPQDRHICDACRGHGQQTTQIGKMFFSTGMCVKCSGTGFLISTPCVACGGNASTSRTIDGAVSVPGMPGGQISVNLHGNNVPVRIERGSDPELELDGINVVSAAVIPFNDGLLGTNIQVRTVRGTKTVRVPPMEYGVVDLRLRGLGAKHGNRDGDHIVTVKVRMPDRQTESKQQC